MTSAATTIELVEATAPRVASVWRALEEHARPSYFLTWGWIENWLSCLPADSLPHLAVVSGATGPFAAFFVGRRRLVRHGVPTRTWHINATGEPQLDELCIEHNAALCEPGSQVSLSTLVSLLPHDWDELILPAVDPSAFDLSVPESVRVRVDREVQAPYIDLARVRATGDYVSLLGPSTRAQLRRARRVCGPTTVEIAHDLASGFHIYDELVALHQRAWRARGETGAFANAWFDRFHRRLIAERLPRGEIQLLRVKAGGATVGCLYNLIAGGRVLFYQSGLAEPDHRHAKPGFVCHAAAVEQNARDGHTIYDLLGGNSQYKLQLATDVSTLLWIRVQRPLARFTLEDTARAALQATRARLRRVI
jgi:CelD/BcsL family acetyltransferase involved in cellulose biosynthesis